MKGIIVKQTEKYVYTRERIELDITTYRLNHRSGWTSYGTFVRAGLGCRVYNSKEEAEHDIVHTARLWNVPQEFFYIEEVQEHRIEYKSHRYKRA